MNAGKPTRSDRIEGLLRGMLAIVLLTAVAWAVAGNPAEGFNLGSLRGW